MDIDVRSEARRRGQMWRLAAASTAVLAAVSLMAPWVRTGGTRRSAFTLTADLRHAGLLTGVPSLLVVAGVVAIPLVALAALGLLATRPPRFPRAAAALASLTGVLTTATALTVIVAAGKRALPGTTAAGVLGVLAAAAGLVAGSDTARSTTHV